jgi:16S rRNA (cytosine967-C5)-methyltransferase
MPLSGARKIAFDVLLRVESESSYASELLHSALTPQIKPADAALATEIALGVLRWRRLLDFLLDRQLKKPVARLDLPVAIALRIGLYQLRFLEKVPARAAVNESVDLVKRARLSSAASLVNAVLRRSAERAKTPVESFLPGGLLVADRLGIVHSHPAWMVERWLARFGEAATIALLEANNRAPRLAVTVHGAVHLDVVRRELESSSLHVEPGHLLNNALIVSGGSVTRTAAFREGRISVQDEASQTVPLLLGVDAGDHVLDLCAAPGGKTAALASAAGPHGLVVAAEIHEHRLRSMREQLSRLRIAIADCAEDRLAPREGQTEASRRQTARVHLVALDATLPLPFATRFQSVLVDAPCSGTGTLARHPEIRWRLRPEQLGEFQALQRKLLHNALTQLAPGGRVVYSTCSMEPEENESVVGGVLNRKDVRLVTAEDSKKLLAPRLAPGISADTLVDSEGFFRTSPAIHRTDGFFAAVLEKTQ